MRKFPQVLLNVQVAKRFDPASVPAVQEAVAGIEQRLGGEAASCCVPPAPSR